MDIQIIDLANPSWLQTLKKLNYDVYHLPEYVYLESQRTQSIPEAILIVDGEKIFFLPYLLRRCDDLFDGNLTIPEVFDVVSPYGYPGFLLSEAAANTPHFLNLALEKLKSVFLSKRVCSAFLRLHPILNQNSNEVLASQLCQVSGETISIDLRLSTAEIWQQTRPEHRTCINRCKRYGFTPKMVNYLDYIDNFIDIYTETMKRVGANKYFYFDYKYFASLANLNENIHLCILELNNQVACAGIFTECGEIIQYHLGGTKNEFLKHAPSKLMFDYVRFWAKERGNKFLHLGGGVGAAKDSLYNFKAGFSKQRYSFFTSRLITDEEKYVYLVELRAKSLKTEPETLLKSNFFPAYRSLK
ncbi:MULTISPECIES: GNAT family N-acetyltransferase [Nostoc]|uniref:GNAT family N-acetyltransferase n=2 Tax=Nostoc TaxID=1177 RepID=A0ABR8ICD1_9NOSO|nr:MULTISPECIES: GNAT family N-acetyltransferase [Nostoc]MBD2563153.1 GNAT family N-acetyltransferase [Nostoc linckia FACHB-391]MBD2648482.1 GNAT family N-acetyltransferase [Nostoc foliaceum FACHB-393]